MSDDDKKKPGLFDPELADQILRAALEGKTLDVPEETAEEKPAPTRPPKKHKSSGKSAQRPPREVAPRVEASVALSPEDEKLLDGFYWKLLKKYEARKFFTEKFTSHDLSELMDFFLETLKAEDRQKYLTALRESMPRDEDQPKKEFSPMKFWEDYLYVYLNFGEALTANDFERAGLQGEEKAKYEERLLVLGKFLERQKEFVRKPNMRPVYEKDQKKQALESFDLTWRSLYLNNDERLARVIPNTLLRQFWFGVGNGRNKTELLSKGQKAEFAQNVDVFSGDWRRLANYTVNWEVEQLLQLKEKVLEPNYLLKNFTNDILMIKQLLEQICADAKFEGKEVLKAKEMSDDAEKFMKKWFRHGAGLFVKLHKTLLWFDKFLKGVEQELKNKKISREEADKQILAAKEDVLLVLVKMEADLLRATDIKETQQSPEDILSAELSRPSEVPEEKPLAPFQPSAALRRFMEEEEAGEVESSEEESEPPVKKMPPVRPSEFLRKLMEEETAGKNPEASSEQEPPAEDVKIEQKEEHQIGINEYSFLKNILSDGSLSDALSGEIFEQIKALPKVVYKQDLPSVDKAAFDEAWKQAVEVLHQRINELLNKVDDNSAIRKYLPSLEAQLGVQGITPGYDPVYDLDSLEKRWELYQALRISAELQ